MQIIENEAVPSGYDDAVVNESLSFYVELQGTSSAGSKEEEDRWAEQVCLSHPVH